MKGVLPGTTNELFAVTTRRNGVIHINDPETGLTTLCGREWWFKGGIAGFKQCSACVKRAGKINIHASNAAHRKD